MSFLLKDTFQKIVQLETAVAGIQPKGSEQDISCVQLPERGWKALL